MKYSQNMCEGVVGSLHSNKNIQYKQHYDTGGSGKVLNSILFYGIALYVHLYKNVTTSQYYATICI